MCPIGCLNWVMRHRWQLILPAVGLVAFGGVTYQSLRMDRLVNRGHSRYFYWSSLPLDSEPSQGHAPASGPCNNGDPTCFEVDFTTMWVDPGWLSNLLVLTAAPAFVLSGLIVSLLGKLGVSQVFSFFAFTPFLILAWYYLLGWLIDRRRERRLRNAQTAASSSHTF